MIYWVAPCVYPTCEYNSSNNQTTHNGASHWGFDNPRTRAVMNIARQLAIEAQCAYVWIRRGNHDMKYIHNPDGTRVVKFDHNGCPTGFVMVEADPHITLSLGVDDQTLVIHGHINVIENDAKVPVGIMQEGTREHVTGGDGRVLELFEWVDRNCLKIPSQMCPASHCHAHSVSELDQHICHIQNWKTQHLVDHFCPCNHEIRGDHYCPCRHDEIRRTDHTCVCPHKDAAGMYDHWCPCIHDETRYNLRLQ